MKTAFKRNKERIGDINERIEDNLSGIRVVKSFANEDQELERFDKQNGHYVSAKKNSYYYMGRYNAGLTSFTSLINGSSCGCTVFQKSANLCPIFCKIGAILSQFL